MLKPNKVHLDIAGYASRLRQRIKDLRGVKQCASCLEKTADPQAGYCTVCGTKTLHPGRVPEMIYEAIKLNENGKALVCPHCDNEELTPGDYCIICGSDIINRCADMPDPENESMTIRGCHTILPGNARFCSRCGNESAFYQKSWLKDWRSENTRKAIENVSVAFDFEEIKKERTSG